MILPGLYFIIILSGRSHSSDLSSPDEQSGAVCLSDGAGSQRKHPGYPGKVAAIFLIMCVYFVCYGHTCIQITFKIGVLCQDRAACQMLCFAKGFLNY